MTARPNPPIAERAPSITGTGAAARLARRALHELLAYPRTVQRAPLPGPAMMQKAARMIERDVRVSGLSHTPAGGPALIVTTHPKGIADGLVLTRVLGSIRQDV